MKIKVNQVYIGELIKLTGKVILVAVQIYPKGFEVILVIIILQILNEIC